MWAHKGMRDCEESYRKKGTVIERSLEPPQYRFLHTPLVSTSLNSWLFFHFFPVKKWSEQHATSLSMSKSGRNHWWHNHLIAITSGSGTSGGHYQESHPQCQRGQLCDRRAHVSYFPVNDKCMLMLPPSNFILKTLPLLQSVYLEATSVSRPPLAFILGCSWFRKKITLWSDSL